MAMRKSIIENLIIYLYPMYKYSKNECIIKSIEQNIIIKASDVLTLHFSFVVCYRVFGRREDTANMFVVNALICQN